MTRHDIEISHDDDVLTGEVMVSVCRSPSAPFLYVRQRLRLKTTAGVDADMLPQFCLPPAPHCRQSSHTSSPADTSLHSPEPLPSYCDPHEPPPWGYLAPAPARDPRTGLIRHDFLRHMGDRDVWFIQGDVALHSWYFKSLEGYEAEWEKHIKGKMWAPPAWLKAYSDHYHGPL
jgi:hypothetical protein